MKTDDLSLLELIRIYHDTAMDRQRIQMTSPHDHGLIRDTFKIEQDCKAEIERRVQALKEIIK